MLIQGSFVYLPRLIENPVNGEYYVPGFYYNMEAPVC
jgi:hypothetical protein